MVEADRADVWPRLLDVETVASWLPIMHSVTEVSTGGSGIDGSSIDGSGIDGSSIDGSGIDGSSIDGSGIDGSGIDGSSFQAAFEDKVGPFSLRADLRIEVAGVRESEEVSIRARGEDRQIHSRIMIDAAAHLADAGPGRTRVRLSGAYEITGRVATLGAGVIRSKASKLIDTFCTNAAAGLAGIA